MQTVTVPSRTVDGRTNTYAAHLMPWRSATGNLVVALSNNAWFMDPLALDNPTLYQPRLFELAAPPGMPVPQLAATTEPLGFLPASPPIRAIDTRNSARLAGRADAASPVGRGCGRRCSRRRDRPRGGRPQRRRLPHCVVVRRADATDVEPQLRRRHDAGDPCGRHLGRRRVDLRLHVRRRPTCSST